MPKVRDFYMALDKLAPFSSALPWDNAGLIIGDMDYPADQVLLALDVTRDVVNEAVSKDVQLIITHHPVIFSGIKTIGHGILRDVVMAGISVISAHTNLDTATDGVNDVLAELLGLSGISVYGEEGLIRLGSLDSAIGMDELALSVKEKLSCVCVKYNHTTHDKPVRRVAVIGGAGGDYIREAAECGADVIITGELKHHEWIEALECGIGIIEAGHYDTEVHVLKPLAEKLRSIVSGADIYVSESVWDINVR